MTYRVIRRQTENPIEKRVVTEAMRLYGLRSIKLKLQYDAGWPDRMLLVPGGRPLFIEFKAAGKPRTELQTQRHADLVKWGYDVETHDKYDEAMLAISKRVLR